MLRFRKVLAIALVAVGIAAFVIHHVSWSRLSETSPSSPNPMTGQVYALSNHSSYFYVTRDEKTLGDVCIYITWIAFLTAGVINVYWKVFPSPLDDAPRKFY